MKRNFTQDLVSWKRAPRRKPLMVIGARQVGKTYTIEEFCTTHFARHTTVNLLERNDIVQLYDTVTTAQNRFEQLMLLLNVDPRASEHILFVDEVQESEAFIADLKYIHEQHPQFNLVTAGSLLGVRLKRFKKSFPVGQVSFLRVGSMTFDEFLTAIDAQRFIAPIRQAYAFDTALPAATHDQLLRYYREYLCIGGMPESVLAFIDNGSSLVGLKSQVLNDIVLAYKHDMNKYVTSNAEALKIAATYDSLPAQLNNAARKFMYRRVESTARKRGFQSAIDWLVASQMVMACHQITKADTPLKAYADVGAFKLYLSDVGILVNELHLPFGRIISDTLGEKKGILAENYVAQHLTATGSPLYYWVSPGNAEIDFLLETGDGIIPIEVKAGDNVRSKSLQVYREKYQPISAIRVSARNFGNEGGIKSVPLYAAFCLGTAE